MNITKNIKKGDIFYVEVNKRFFFMQIIHITENLPPPYQRFKFGYFIVVFEKSFLKLPESISELDLTNIYRIKYRPKNGILYVSHWDTEPQIKVKENRINWERHSGYRLEKFGNAPISQSFHPEIDRDFTMPAHSILNEDGIQISHSPDDINWIYRTLEQDEQKREEKKRDIKPVYFSSWIEDVEPEAILKTEKAIAAFESECQTRDVKRALLKCLKAINRLNDNLQFVTTLEAEDLHDKLLELAVQYGITEKEAIDTIEDTRNW